MWEVVVYGSGGTVITRERCGCGSLEPPLCSSGSLDGGGHSQVICCPTCHTALVLSLSSSGPTFTRDQ